MDLDRATWRKSSYSGTNGGNCIEAARDLPGVVAVRDSKDRLRGCAVCCCLVSAKVSV